MTDDAVKRPSASERLMRVGMMPMPMEAQFMMGEIYADVVALEAALSATEQGEAVREAEAWLRAISDWLLSTDNDMKLPEGTLDTDPLDIADRLAAIRKETERQSHE